jgi:hypothetical protein
VPKRKKNFEQLEKVEYCLLKKPVFLGRSDQRSAPIHNSSVKMSVAHFKRLVEIAKTPTKKVDKPLQNNLINFPHGPVMGHFLIATRPQLCFSRCLKMI